MDEVVGLAAGEDDHLELRMGCGEQGEKLGEKYMHMKTTLFVYKCTCSQAHIHMYMYMYIYTPLGVSRGAGGASGGNITCGRSRDNRSSAFATSGVSGFSCLLFSNSGGFLGLSGLALGRSLGRSALSDLTSGFSGLSGLSGFSGLGLWLLPAAPQALALKKAS